MHDMIDIALQMCTRGDGQGGQTGARLDDIKGLHLLLIENDPL